MNIIIRELKDYDWDKVKNIYEKGINTGNATFETTTPTWEHWNKNHLSNCRLVAEIENKVIAWAALSPVSSRCIYSGVAEVSVYVDDEYKNYKVGTKILSALIEKSEISGIWTLEAGIFPKNVASIKLHEKLGFRQVGVRKKIGKLNGIWRDTILLERRSQNIS